MNEMIAFCGLDCSSCEAFTATHSGDPDRLVALAHKWSNERLWLTAEDVRCVGCRQQEGPHYEWCAKCAIRVCGLGKPVSDCADCGGFPCRLIDASPDPEIRPRLMALKARRRAAAPSA